MHSPTGYLKVVKSFSGSLNCHLAAIVKATIFLRQAAGCRQESVLELSRKTTPWSPPSHSSPLPPPAFSAAAIAPACAAV
ncbi:hypothetical protein EIKCOROL_00816 [Eikenella corrodens ATCC 23834]|uniref:Uncharacterized protein n=1 Tax=Eikenella corrodens ATCC 23834 TaxID=546274 RepID=C0DTY5_EIKCO|nr:hypothetical protein EIKCOROL_00816 [Eikenella corrodens ATCC 23834]